jgi:formylglycine-generating enzyme required for sulfatase activity
MKTTLLTIAATCALLMFSFTTAKKPSMKTALKALEGFCNYVPSGNSVVNGDTASVQAFYMSSGEITNLQYKEFLYELEKNGEMEKLKIAAIDSLGWRTEFSYNERYSDYYHRHPAYAGYPVVNVSKEGAELFCEWLSQKYDSLSNGELKLSFRLPTHAEWMRAARGGNHNSVYTWGGPFLRNAKGNYLANFMALGAENITKNSETGELEVVSNLTISVAGDANDVTAPVLSYSPNDYGIHNMNGNVAEMISDGDYAVGGDWLSPGYDIRNESIKPFTQPNPTVGFRVVATYISTNNK